MQQLRAFDQSKGGSKAGYCLQNVRLGFSIPALYNDAWTAWRNTDQHTGAIPTGVDVPLYYDYTDRNGNRYGHINVRLKDGRIWNDGRYFQSMQTFQSSMSNVRYVGWSTSINNVKVIEKGDTVKIGSEANWRWRFNRLHRQLVRNGDMNDTVWKSIIGQDPWKVVESWSSHPEADQLMKDSVMGEQARKDNWQKQIVDLRAINTQLTDTTKAQTQTIIELQLKVKELEAQLAVVGDDTKNLNKLGETLKWFISRMGLK